MDAHKNFAYSTVATAPTPASSGTSLTLAAGEGARMPAAPFDLTVWPTAAQPLPSNAELVRVTAIATDTLTIVRQQQGTSARSIVVGDQVSASINAKMLDEPTFEDAPGDELSVPSGMSLFVGDELDLSADVELIAEGEAVFV